MNKITIEQIASILTIIENRTIKLDLLFDYMLPNQALFLLHRYETLSPVFRTQKNVEALIRANLEQITNIKTN